MRYRPLFFVLGLFVVIFVFGGLCFTMGVLELRYNEYFDNKVMALYRRDGYVVDELKSRPTFHSVDNGWRLEVESEGLGSVAFEKKFQRGHTRQRISPEASLNKTFLVKEGATGIEAVIVEDNLGNSSYGGASGSVKAPLFEAFLFVPVFRKGRYPRYTPYEYVRGRSSSKIDALLIQPTLNPDP